VGDELHLLQILSNIEAIGDHFHCGFGVYLLKYLWRGVFISDPQAALLPIEKIN
jgi:hypothetical protein